MSCPLSALATIAAMTATQLQQDESYLPYNDPVVAGADAAVCKQETDDEEVDATAEVAADHQPTATSSSDDDSHASDSSSRSTSSKKPMKKRAVPADHVYNYSQQSYHHQDYESSSSVDEKDSQERIVREGQPPLKRHRGVPGPNNKKRTKQTKKSNSNNNNPARRPRSNSGGTSKTNNQPSFPALLMGIMSASQNKEYISFLSDDRSFIIVNPEMLVSHVLPMYFTERDGDDDDDNMNFGDFLELLDVWYVSLVGDVLGGRGTLYHMHYMLMFHLFLYTCYAHSMIYTHIIVIPPTGDLKTPPSHNILKWMSTNIPSFARVIGRLVWKLHCLLNWLPSLQIRRRQSRPAGIITTATTRGVGESSR